MPEFVITNEQSNLVLPAFIQVPVVSSRVNEQSVYADIINRCESPDLSNGRATNGHESTHMLQAQIRNANGGIGINAFYLLEGRAALVKEPAIRKSATVPLVPRSLRGSRFDLYVAGQSEWDDCPLYLCDEWSAYINGCATAYDDATHGRTKENSDEACGPIELGIYCVAMAMAVGDKGDEQFKQFMLYQWKRCLDVFAKAAPLFPFDSQDKLVNSLRTSADAEDMRAFIKVNLGGLMP